MAERSFAAEVERLKLGEGETFVGEGILAVTKALLQSGVAYVGGYQGSPISHLMDVFADANDLLASLGVHFEASASEATAAAMLAASVNYPLRGAVAWKSVVGTNVASDALSNVASGGVTGGALVIVGEDYGEGSSIMQERTHAFAMKSQMWLMDPRPNLPSIVDAVESAFQLSEASNTPVMLEMRVRSCHMTGSFVAKDNVRPAMTVDEAAASPVRDTNRIVLPPANFLHEVEKVEKRWPAGIAFVRDNKLNEWFGPDEGEVGLIVQGGLFNSLNRGLELLGLSDALGASQLPIYCLNVTYPLIPDEVAAFCHGKRAVLILEEGQPEFIEHELNTLVRRADLQTRIVGKDVLPRAGDYTAETMARGVRKFAAEWLPSLDLPDISIVPLPTPVASQIPQRPAGFCTGCPERPIFTSMKLLERELGPAHVSADIGCHLFSILPPFNIGNTTMGYGLGTAGASAFKPKDKRAIAVMGDGGFWHNGLTSGIGNAVFNKDDTVTVIIDNGYSAATGGQDILSSRADNRARTTRHPIERAVRGIGAGWVRTVNRTYDLKRMTAALREAMTSPERGPKIVIAQSECMLNKQRREKPVVRKAMSEGKRVERERFGIDPDTCTGDHSCIRLSGCPSLSIKPNPDPLRQDPIAHVDNSCVGCGLCGEVSHAAVLCPSFYRANIVANPGRWEGWWKTLRSRLIGGLQARDARVRAARAF
ncbi:MULTISPECIES: indolepyruvate ferredoxin oxidoreductase subunit alpha [unclassified Sphingomonas]|uniref:indolepyruvate ferredoxin oxidoreductase subunit alpha n=1 Tax=unclassified Sphingomonas TaxID=196159 RepID=UPI0006F38F72|nr:MULTISPECIES: indolepyruvate ferredoxin oxidoreductase subunit alpha [unclassified Sphingomonas]KQX22808.1 indolepyruvate ferredoxin oxidoreductase [Sphingomonas sp. Root1294]KQY67712.1 indolepyruvate ferredoxin oxidoreductase [Sphingomonas sp. Root50]KRB88654.1 indolepyruvate ferredoxin oxidoreductase [Sphingomonas sp. Root720]